MSVRAVYRYVNLTVEPDREPDAEPETYATECAVCLARSPHTEQPEAARDWIPTTSGTPAAPHIPGHHAPAGARMDRAVVRDGAAHDRGNRIGSWINVVWSTRTRRPPPCWWGRAPWRGRRQSTLAYRAPEAAGSPPPTHPSELKAANTRPRGPDRNRTWKSWADQRTPPCPPNQRSLQTS